MPKETTGYSFKKPLYSENADIGVLNENFDMLDKVLTPDVSAIDEPGTANGGKIEIVLGWIANRIKAITGLPSWKAAPAVTLKQCSEHILSGTHSAATSGTDGFMSKADKKKLDNATSENASGSLMQRDENGRVKVNAPENELDATNKEYVDSKCILKNSASAMQARLTAHSNTLYTTKQVRNIVFWTSGDTPPATDYGDVVIKTF